MDISAGTHVPTERPRRDIGGVIVSLAGIALAIAAASTDLWRFSNAWIGTGVRDPSVPAEAFNDAASADWWGVLGPDVADRFHPVTEALTTMVPVAIVVIAALVPLLFRRFRPMFGAAVAVGVAMWATSVAAWAAIYRDNNDAWVGLRGGWIMLLGLVLAFAGASWDLVVQSRRPVPSG